MDLRHSWKMSLQSGRTFASDPRLQKPQSLTRDIRDIPAYVRRRVNIPELDKFQDTTSSASVSSQMAKCLRN